MDKQSATMQPGFEHKGKDKNSIVSYLRPIKNTGQTVHETSITEQNQSSLIEKRSMISKSPKKSRSPSKQKKQDGYLDAIANQEANLISMTSLQEGEEFERDINNIIGIIDGVEKNMNPNRLTNQFARNANVSYNRRKIEMSRTIQAQ